MKERVKVLFLVLLLVAVASVFMVNPGYAKATKEPSTLNFVIPSDPTSLEPGLTVMMYDSLIALNLHAGLFTYDNNSKAVPYLVKKWSVSEDGTSYTFQLRNNVKWQDGPVVTAEDIKKGWERTLEPALKGWGANYLKTIVGAKDIIDGKTTKLSGVKVVDSQTLQVTLVSPDPIFIEKIATTPGWVVPSNAVVAGKPAWQNNPIGMGPFKYVEFQSKVQLSLEANSNFFKGRPKLERVKFLVVPDAATCFNMYQTGEADIVPVAATELKRLNQDPELSKQLHFWTKAQLTYLGFNLQKVKAFQDVRVRQAFAYAVDRKQIIEKVLFKAWQPASGIVLPNVPGYDAGMGYSYDPSKAKKLLGDAGYPDGKGFPTLQFVAVASTEMLAAEAIAAQIRANLGLQIEVFQPEPATFYSGLRAHNKYDLFISGWTADYPSAEQWLYNLLYSGLGSNFTGYDNQAYNSIVTKAMSSQNDNARTKLWRQANKMATVDAPIIPLGYGQFIYLVKPNVSGFSCNIFTPMGFYSVTKK